MTQQNYAEYVNKLKPAEKRLIRDIEKVNIKLNNGLIATEFIQHCINNNILPNFTKISIKEKEKKNIDNTEEECLRKQHLLNEIKNKIKLISELQARLMYLENLWLEIPTDDETKNVLIAHLANLKSNHFRITKNRSLNKILKLSKNSYKIDENDRQTINHFVNLSKYKLNHDEINFLNLGVNCHIIGKPKLIEKEIEIEKMMDDILELERNKSIIVNPTIGHELIVEAKKHRGTYNSTILTPSMKLAVKSLKNNSNIVIRKADKSSMYVILDKSDYTAKLNDILIDSSKFQIIDKDPTTELKTNLNKILKAHNKSVKMKENKYPVLVGQFKPGYIYGNVKTHKVNNPLRPVISQSPTVTYPVATFLNKILSPYVPNKYMIKSSYEFLNILSTSEVTSDILSLDVESLFTNIPVNDTIEIILNKVYNSSMKPLEITKMRLKKLLKICTQQAPFYSPDGILYRQVDGVSMGSPLGPLFANFYMGYLEDKIFVEYPDLKPLIYTRYVDDIFIAYNDFDKVIKLINIFNNTKLKFTYELSKDSKLPFLDVLVSLNEYKYNTSVYIKPTNIAVCLNGRSECSENYKLSTIRSFVNRAFTHSSDHVELDTELKRVSNLLINNNYDKNIIQQVINNKYNDYFFTKESIIENNKRSTKNIIDSSMQENSNNTNNLDLSNKIKENKEIILYYKNMMSNAYKKDESAIRNIIYRNIKVVDPQSNLKLRIYYQNKKTFNLVSKNNCLPRIENPLYRSHVIYSFKCNVGDCVHLNSEYIGMTRTFLSRRLSLHLQDGAIKKHFIESHNMKLTRKNLEDNTKIIYANNNFFKLRIAESLNIAKFKPAINIQHKAYTILPTNRMLFNQYKTQSNIEDKILEEDIEQID